MRPPRRFPSPSTALKIASVPWKGLLGGGFSDAVGRVFESSMCTVQAEPACSQSVAIIRHSRPDRRHLATRNKAECTKAVRQPMSMSNPLALVTMASGIGVVEDTQPPASQSARHL